MVKDRINGLCSLFFVLITKVLDNMERFIKDETTMIWLI